jgi:hypothetical protein
MNVTMNTGHIAVHNIAMAEICALVQIIQDLVSDDGKFWAYQSNFPEASWVSRTVFFMTPTP